MHNFLGDTLSGYAFAMALMVARSALPAHVRAVPPQAQPSAIEKLRAAANRAVAAKLELDALAPSGDGTWGPSSGNWVEIDLPPSRPDGNWVAWKYRSGAIAVRGTSRHAPEIDGFIRAVMKPFEPSKDLIEIELHREPDGPHGPGGISVGATVIFGHQASYYVLGHLDRGAAAWLDETYSRDMPVAAELVRLASDGKRYVINLACLMPSKEQRAQFEL
ncbi:hypothetical protein [Mangrovicoccus sp. HB161399]|uniref:hypothetical protein n=1 Tax=Mangrovicoccus sp. HB161399 TaxID=2720392 RepID=UPI001558059E|nr:hypothetical protein [Mangrovicoccus sp. HB161399]